MLASSVRSVIERRHCSRSIERPPSYATTTCSVPFSIASAAPMRLSYERADADVAERDLVAVVLECEVSGLVETVARHLRELARGDLPLPLGAPELVLEELHAVQPMLDVAAAHQDARLVPAADRARAARRRRL